MMPALTEYKSRARANLRAVVALVVEAMEIKTRQAFEDHAWDYMWSFYKGKIDAFGFIDRMAAEIANQFTRGWREGARLVGMDPSEITEEDQAVLADMIRGETDLLGGVAGAIEIFQAPEGKDPDEAFRTKFKQRAVLWAQGYDDALSAAQLQLGNKQRLEWILGEAEEHCHTGDNKRSGIGCVDLNGMVLFAAEWYAANIKPQSEVTNCGGWQCRCKLTPTEKRRTTNGYKKLMAMIAAAGM